MFFRLLKLAGVDVQAKLAELRADLSYRAEHVSEQVSRKARTMAVVAGLLAIAALMVLLAMIVGLVALYKWGELHYGVFGGLALAAAVLIALAAALAAAAFWISSRSEKLTLPGPAPESWRPPQPLPEPVSYAPARNAAQLASAPAPAVPQDLIEPMLVLLGRYLRPPHTGQAAVDDMLRQIGPRAAGMTNEAVARSAELVRHGSRPTMLSVLGAAALFGFLVVHRPAD